MIKKIKSILKKLPILKQLSTRWNFLVNKIDSINNQLAVLREQNVLIKMSMKTQNPINQSINSKKQIRINFVKNLCIEYKELFINLLKDDFELIIDDLNFDYLFVSEHMYWQNNHEMRIDFFEKMHKAITIVFMREALFPDFNLFDYAICFDEIDFQNRTLKIPNIDFFKNSIFTDIDTFKIGIDFKKVLKEKKKFCNYIYSNELGHENRELIFNKLSEYKFVHALGKHKQNVNIENENFTHDANWRKEIISMKQPYKFSIAFENALYRGYTTEKILSSVQAHTIPIYWGNPDIGKEYNTNAFINCHDFDNFEEVVKYVKIVDNDDNLWCHIVSQPFRTPEQIQKSKSDYTQFKQVFKNIFTQDKIQAKKKPEGFWVRNYTNVIKQDMVSKISDTIF